MASAGRRRPVASILLALLLAGVGAVAGTAFHWYVVEPSDGELLTIARGVTLTGYSSATGPALGGRWAPSFTRAQVHWDATSDGSVDAEAAAADLSADGWTVTKTTLGTGTARVQAVHGRAAVGVFLSPARGGGTGASISVTRRALPPTLSLCVLVGMLGGAVGGAFGGALRGWRA